MFPVNRRVLLLFPLLTLFLLLGSLALMAGTARPAAAQTTGADLRIVKFSSPTNEVQAGQQFTYTIIVDNLGPDTANNVVITDTLVTSSAVDPNGCSIAVRTDGGAIDEFNCNFALSTGVFDLGTFGANHLNPRSPDDFGRIIVTINATAENATDMSNLTTVVSDTPDPNMENNTAITTLSVTNDADLRIVKFSSPTNEVRAGEQFTYTIIVDNLGPNPAVNVVITDTLVTSSAVDPNGCSIAIRTDGGAIDEFNCNFALSTGVFDLGTMGSNHLNPRSPSDQGRIIITINATADNGTDMSSFTTVVADTPDPNIENNAAITTLSVTDVSDLILRKSVVGQVQLDGEPAGTYTVTNGEVTAGALLTYTLAVTNAGPSTAENVLLQDPLPEGLAVIEAQTAQGNCTAGQTVTCGLGTLGANRHITLSVVARAAASLPGGVVLNNQAVVSSDVFDVNNGYNRDTASVLVHEAADLWVDMTQLPETILEGEITYIIMAGNDGPSDAPYALVSDIPPTSVTAVTWECVALGDASCAPSGSDVLLTTADLPAGSVVIFTVRGTLPEPQLVVNTANVEKITGSPDPYLPNNRATVTNLLTLNLPAILR